VSQGCRSAGIGCLDCKKIMIKHVIDDLAPFREKRAQYENKPREVEEVLLAGNQKAQAQASQTMTEVRETLGL
jgi:tryptophanyl-tRNA synthetase